MSNNVILNNVEHKDLRVITTYSKEYGDSVNQVLTFPTEFAEVQREYPILFCKNSENKMQAVVILGLDRDENLFLDEKGGWSADYIPAIVARGPFMIGFQKKEVDGQLIKDPTIHINLEDPRVSENDGDAVFLSQGGNSPYLDRVSETLRRVYHGLPLSDSMFTAFEECGLLEPATIEVKLSNTEQYTIQDYFTICEEKLNNLDGNTLERLNKAGYLGLAYLALSSLGNMAKLIQMKNIKKTAV
ncbi:SapC family protein [Teredinibacter haidensis]|uniref:SapC family protein n=1 Tax=Teredinibacter haidensis TaxID=2731755 RepID=UPI00094900C9|nr:SapC family protein [Teredinibacter haidensis]